MIPRFSRRRWAAITLAAPLLLPILGCGGASSAHAVDSSRALEALRTALDGWKAGQSPGSFRESSTPMTIQDFDWSGGARLADYRLLDEGRAYDANLRVRVKLVLDAPPPRAGKRAEKTVWYLVGTSPSVTVFRDAMHR